MKRAICGDRKAPHKPILLLAIIDLVQEGKISSNRIELTPDLITKFKKKWIEYIDNGMDNNSFCVAEGLTVEVSKPFPFKCNIANPFFHLQSESFWSLHKSGNFINKSTYSVKALQENFDYALLDERLFDFIKREESSQILKNFLLNIL